MNDQMVLVDPLISKKEIAPTKYSETGIFQVLSGEFEQITIAFRNQRHYFFEKNLYSNQVEFQRFVKDIKELKNCTSPTLALLCGRAGVGKTTFLYRQLGKTLLDSNAEEFFNLIINFRDYDENKEVSYYQERIIESLAEKVCTILQDLYWKEYSEFCEGKGFNNNLVANSPAEQKTVYKRQFHYLSDKVYRLRGMPLFVAFDNIDLCGELTQKNILAAIHGIKEDYSSLYPQSTRGVGCNQCNFVFIVTMRPETRLRREGYVYDHKLFFPLPNVLRVFTRCLKAHFTERKKVTVNRHIGVTLFDTVIEKYHDMFDYFIRLFESTYIDVWQNHYSERLGDIYNFHNRIVNYNLRSFMLFMWSAIANGGMEPIFFTNTTKRINLFDILAMVIHGSWEFHPGNDRIDGEGFDQKSPIIFSLFDHTDIASKRPDKIILSYLIFVRLLQYFEIKSIEQPTNRISYQTILDDLKPLYNEDDITDALSKLIFSNIITETKAGVRNIAKQQEWRDVKRLILAAVANGDVPEILLESKSTASIYLKNILPEFEYMFQMAATSRLLIDISEKYQKSFYNQYISVVKANAEVKRSFLYSNKELLVYVFLCSFQNIITENIHSYSTKDHGEAVKRYCSIFRAVPYEDLSSEAYNPWLRMVETYCSVLKARRDNSRVENITRDEYLTNISESICLIKDKFLEEHTKVCASYISNNN